MFKCLHAPTGAEIIILQSEWRGRLDVLRLMDRGEELVCQGCRQPVRVRRGSARRRAHFAHKHLQGCLFGSQSPEILAARAALFEWLSARFPGKVDIEKHIPAADLPRPLDCWVDTSVAADTPRERFGCWIIEGSLKLAARERIQAGLQALDAPVTFVLLARLQHPDPQHANRLLLSPTERAFLQHTPLDLLGREGYVYSEDFGSTLHYLDIREGVQAPQGMYTKPVMTTWRGLEKVHEPQGYVGRRLVSNLDQVRVGAGGLFLHPGESEDLRRSQAVLQRVQVDQPHLEQIRQQRQEKLKRWQSTVDPQAPTQPEAVCVLCGQITVDWWTSWMEGGRRLCKCRECLERGLS